LTFSTETFICELIYEFSSCITSPSVNLPGNFAPHIVTGRGAGVAVGIGVGTGVEVGVGAGDGVGEGVSVAWGDAVAAATACPVPFENKKTTSRRAAIITTDAHIKISAHFGMPRLRGLGFASIVIVLSVTLCVFTPGLLSYSFTKNLSFHTKQL
jgi:hypothetical protein